MTEGWGNGTFSYRNLYERDMIHPVDMGHKVGAAGARLGEDRGSLVRRLGLGRMRVCVPVSVCAHVCGSASFVAACA